MIELVSKDMRVDMFSIALFWICKNTGGAN